MQKQPVQFVIPLLIKTVFLLLFLNTSNLCAQDDLVTQTKLQFTEVNNAAITDGKDLRIYNLLENFYNEVLQDEKGELSEKTVATIYELLDNDAVPNWNILFMFMTYQQHISETAAVGKQANIEFQLLATDLLVKECLKIYKKLPAVVAIYQGEAFMSAEKTDQAISIYKKLLIEKPNCVPAKIYIYMLSNDAAEKDKIFADLSKNNPNHWMVMEFLKS
ncbi:tetratricopeptide repeat protein [Flavobacterium cerinum]|uniref:Tetratricopeptide repeat protein n=1 Tax=Flavobacterium cerinum TaxID=2502784 RepID=A0A444HDX0_9FLAO|nr:hypothetical protein [Flavobacterium cerinum]RWX02423.1 hypothetical protein EPI11_04165 [Flavobacterium cerinum]